MRFKGNRLKGVIQTGSRITHTDFFQKDAKKFSGKTEKLIKACQALKEENLCLVNQYAIFNCGKLCNYYETPM